MLRSFQRRNIVRRWRRASKVLSPDEAPERRVELRAGRASKEGLDFACSDSLALEQSNDVERFVCAAWPIVMQTGAGG